MPLFDINYKTLVDMLLPPRLRQTKQSAWLNALVSPVVYIYHLFIANRVANLYSIAHTSQVTKMQAALNDAFDMTARRITITDGPEADPVYLYKAAESKPVFIYKASESRPATLYTYRETQTGQYDFVVQVPTAIAFDPAAMKALIDTYRLPSKRNYKIITV